MRLTTLSFAVLAVSCFAVTIDDAHAVAPFTEDFTSNNAAWTNFDNTGFASWVSAGGSDGGSYLSGSANTSGKMPGARFAVLRGEDDTSASGGAFIGNWQASGINRISAYVRHNASEALPFFLRMSGPGNSPGTSGVWSPPVQPNIWTQITFDLLPSNFNTTLFPESVPMDQLSTFNATMVDVGHIQVGFLVSATMANNPTNFIYDLDKVSISVVPEPACGLLVVGAAVCGLFGRRRRVG